MGKAALIVSDAPQDQGIANSVMRDYTVGT